MADSTSRCRRYRGRSYGHTEAEIIRKEIRKLKAEAAFLMRCKADLVKGVTEADVAEEIDHYNTRHDISYPSNPHGHAVHNEFCGYRTNTQFGCRFEHHNGTCGYNYGEEQSCRINARLVALTEELRHLSRELETV